MAAPSNARAGERPVNIGDDSPPGLWNPVSPPSPNPEKPNKTGGVLQILAQSLKGRGLLEITAAPASQQVGLLGTLCGQHRSPAFRPHHGFRPGGGLNRAKNRAENSFFCFLTSYYIIPMR